MKIMFLALWCIAFAPVLAQWTPPQFFVPLKSAALDFAIIIHDQDVNSQKMALSKLPILLDFGDDMARATILLNDDTQKWIKGVELTGDWTKFEAAVNTYLKVQNKTDRGLGWPIRLVHSGTFPDPMRARVLLIVTLNGDTSGITVATRCWRYAITKKSIPVVEHFGEVLQLGSNYPSLFTAIVAVRGRINRQLCAYEKSRFYEDSERTKCVEDWYTRLVPDRVGNCSTVLEPPTDTLASCNVANCSKTCNDLWPWSSPPSGCSSTCGASISRNGTYTRNNLKFCPTVFECAPCSSSSTQTSVASVSTAIPSSLVPSTAIPSSTGTSPRSASAATSGVTSETGGMAAWEIAVIIVGCICVILICIATVVALAIIINIRKREKQLQPSVSSVGERMSSIRRGGSSKSSRAPKSSSERGTSKTVRAVEDREQSQRGYLSAIPWPKEKGGYIYLPSMRMKKEAEVPSVREKKEPEVPSIRMKKELEVPSMRTKKVCSISGSFSKKGKSMFAN